LVEKTAHVIIFSTLTSKDDIKKNSVIVILLQTGNAGNMSQAFKEAKKYFKSSNEVAGIYKANIINEKTSKAIAITKIKTILPILLTIKFIKVTVIGSAIFLT
jgi:hypothetical protein